MWRLVIAALVFLGGFPSHSQSLKVGPWIQPSMTYYTVRTDGTTGANDFRLQNKPIFAYQAGFAVTRSFSESVVGLTGLVYSERGMRSQFNTNTIYAFNFSPGYSLKVVDRYLEIPLLANIYLKKSTLSWFLVVGLKPAIYLNTRTKAIGVSNQPSSFRYYGHRRVNIFAVVGGGMEVSIHSNWSLLVFPTLEHAILSDIYGQGISLFPYSLGINVCLLYSLGN